MAFWRPGWWMWERSHWGGSGGFLGYERGHWRRKPDSSPPWMRATHGLLKVLFGTFVLLYWYGAVRGAPLPRLVP